MKMGAEQPIDHTPPLDSKLAGTRDLYRRTLQNPDLSDKEIDDMRQYVIRLAQALCEHVWGTRFY